MLERLPNKATIVATIALALGGLGLAGCGGSTKEGTWKVGVNCPPEATDVHVSNLDQTYKMGTMANTGSASLTVECTDGSGIGDPTGFELLSGPGTTVHQNEKPTDVITIGYSYDTGDFMQQGDDPRVEFSSATQKAPALIVMQGVNKVESVNVR